MGEAKRRKDRGERANGIKIPPRKQVQGFRLVHHHRFEEQDAEGRVFARNVFAVASEDGDLVVEETPDGPKPVLLVSVAQPIRQSVLVRA